MKIGIDARMYGVGFTGIGRYNAELIKHLIELDKENTYVLFLKKKAYDEFQCPNERFEKRLADFDHYSLDEQLKFNRLLKKEKLDLMHFTHFNAPILYNRPFIVTIHDLTLSFFPGKKMNHPIYRLAYHLVIRRVTKRAKKIIAVSKNTKKDLIESLKIKDEKVEVIYNGVSKKFAETAGQKPVNLKEKYAISKPFFLYTGVWRDHKNLVGLIKAFKALDEKKPDQFELVITGSNNATYHEVPDTIKKLNLSQKVHLVGLVPEEDLYQLYISALAYVFPSFYEGFGLPPLEAMQCGTPTLVSNVSAMPEVCGSENALYFDPYNIGDICEKMEEIASNEVLRESLVKRGYERVKQFDWGKMSKAILEIYKTFNGKIQ